MTEIAAQRVNVSAPDPSARTLSDQVRQKLIDSIVSGELAQGSKISEAELAQRYGISRGPLREAIRQLWEAIAMRE